MTGPEHKAGFVNILGNPNVGKSTLMNKLIGQNLSIITSKAQTTRHRILGILNGEGYQIVFSDTPGILKPRYVLQESMLKAAASALEDADMLLLVITPEDDTLSADGFFERIVECKAQKIIVINKIDLSSQDALEQLVAKWNQLLPGAPVVPVSAKHDFNLSTLLRLIVNNLPAGEPYFPEDQLSDRFERFFASEIIREKILLNYRKEIPYSVEVEIESYNESPDLISISAIIHVERTSQKGIVIGHRGEMLKKTGTMARAGLEDFLGRKVFLTLRVRVTEDWRHKQRMMKQFGYQ
ncbi:MAG: GTPase Era [Bacteroidetes bacterium]|nr:GTPase Era [Bacteroidota bacterium]